MSSLRASRSLLTLLGSELRRSAARRCSVLSRHLTSGTRRMSASSSEDEVLFSGEGLRVITLNRPKALNALNQNMAELITGHMQRVADDPSTYAVLMEGAGEKAFCAGGDIRAVTEAGKAGHSLAQTFFLREYTLNHLIGTFKKPFIALQDGITMGGGVGLSVHGPFRVATEHTVFAMPETFIGLFPDVGGSYFLPRLPGSLGMYLALSGHRLKGRDVVFAGVATHFVPRQHLPALKERIGALCSPGGTLSRSDPSTHQELVKNELDQFHKQNIGEFPQEQFSLHSKVDTINRCFDKSSVEGILDALKAEGTEWSKQVVETLGKMSPTSMKVTHHQLVEGAKLSFKDCFIMEYRMAQACMAGKDFYEGVRAVIVDKDNKPRWDPPTLDAITEEIVLNHFAPLPGRELDL